MADIVYRIVDGPSKYDLSLALFDRKSVNNRQVVFKTDKGEELHATIQGVQAEDGSGESWNLEGYFFSRLRGSMAPPPQFFKMYFHTGRRNGVVTEVR